MYEPLKRLVLRLLRVPPEPHPPAGSPGSVRIFRAGRNYYRYKLALWGLRQLGAVAGLIVFFSFKTVLDRVQLPPPMQVGIRATRLVETPIDPETGKPRPLRIGDISGFLLVIEAFALTAFAVALPYTFALVRLDYEMRWYIVTDRSLRIREGVRQVSEMTMTFANVQNLTIKQGPIQRLLGIADLHVKTAGGGGGSHKTDHDDAENMHEGYFSGVDNAPEIRDLVLALLRNYRGAGLGDPDEPRHEAIEAPPPDARSSDTLDAARELLAEAKALRHALGGGHRA